MNENEKSILDDIIPGTWETRLENLSNAVALLSLVRDPEPILVDVDMLAELLRLANK